MRVGVIGGGINGLCIAFTLSSKGADVHLFERARMLSCTSSKSTKLLHGGLRYLEYGQFSLVKESLKERTWWLKNAPDYTQMLNILIPVYSRKGHRKRWKIKLGLAVYDWLDSSNEAAKSKWLSVDAVLQRMPGINSDGLQGGFLYCDGQMDEAALGKWVERKALNSGVKINSHCEVKSVSKDGVLTINDGETRHYDCIINAAGPWVESLLKKSGIKSKYALSYIKGSHILIKKKFATGFLVEHPTDNRPVFILPYQNTTLIGTTEVEILSPDNAECDKEERKYLIDAFNSVVTKKIDTKDILSEFSGVRPIVKSGRHMHEASRECSLEQTDKLINVWGGKWTTAMALSRKVSSLVMNA